MFKFIKKLVPIFLIISILCSLMSVFVSAANIKDRSKGILKRSELILEKDIWNKIDSLEKKKIISTRSRAVTAKNYADLSDDVEALVRASKTYVKGSIVRNGDFFSWETSEGIACCYSPVFRYKTRNNAEQGLDATETVSYATRGGSSDSKDVYLIGPYYGYDETFTDQYKNEAKSIAKTMGGTYTLYQGANATITNIATAMQNGGIVIFDSHGNTDYYNQTNGDCVSRANTSYLCLKSGSGITDFDKTRTQGPYGIYYHTLYGGDNTYLVDGTVIKNHMTKAAPNSILWMATCLSMATDGLYKPMRDAGVEVVYGYSQSVSFTGDYEYETYFWNKMKDGSDVKTAAAYMKSASGSDWDPAYSFFSQSQAKRYYVAFPIFVSDEDAYPGRSEVNAVQTVKSTYRLKPSKISFSLINKTYSITQGSSCTIEGIITSNYNLKKVEARYNGKVYKTISDFTNYKNSIPITVSNGLIPFRTPELSLGIHKLTITATDELNVSASFTITIKVNGIPIYRLYNPNSGEHFYTGSGTEKINLVKSGWKDEGILLYAPVTYGEPVYRLYNPNTSYHHYTSSKTEKDNLVRAGWNYEGVAFNSSPANSHPIYRLYNPNSGLHNYTGSMEERLNLEGLGWNYEGVAFYDAPPV